MIHLLVEAFQVHCNLVGAHLVQVDHYNYLVQFLVDEGDIQASPSYGVDEVVELGDILLDVSAHEGVVVLPMGLFDQVNDVLTLDL